MIGFIHGLMIIFFSRLYGHFTFKFNINFKYSLFIGLFVGFGTSTLNKYIFSIMLPHYEPGFGYPIFLFSGLVLGFSDEFINIYTERLKMINKYKNDINIIIDIMNFKDYTINYNQKNWLLTLIITILKYDKKNFIESHPYFKIATNEYITITNNDIGPKATNYVDQKILYYKNDNATIIQILTTASQLDDNTIHSRKYAKMSFHRWFDYDNTYVYVCHARVATNLVDEIGQDLNGELNFNMKTEGVIKVLENNRDDDTDPEFLQMCEYYEKIDKDFPNKIALITRFISNQLGG
jgi:hypothetical protein